MLKHGYHRIGMDVLYMWEMADLQDVRLHWFKSRLHQTVEGLESSTDQSIGIYYTDLAYTNSLGFAAVGGNAGHNGTSYDAVVDDQVLADFVYRS
jgi:hypothetical protein